MRTLKITSLELHTWNLLKDKTFGVSENDYNKKDLPSREISKELIKIHYRIYHDLDKSLTEEDIRNDSNCPLEMK